MSSASRKVPRARAKPKEEMKEQIVAQVHKPVVSATSSENDYDDNLESNKTYTRYQEDKNDNVTVHTPSRDISIDGETQINSKILSLIETEMKRDINKHSHFTDSRPQSLSFYEDEKIPEELSGNLELLSPEERKHYKKRKEYPQIDTDEMNAYNAIQDSYSAREAEEILSSSLKKSSKSRKKRHAESEIGIGDSREMMIPKEKKKSKKKKRETSPVNNNGNKRKHKKRGDDDYELRNDVTAALEELQDDVFESNVEEHAKSDRARKSPRKSDKLYVQKKNKFEAMPRSVSSHLSRQGAQDVEEAKFGKKYSTYPLEVAFVFQRCWMRLSTLCHGLLGGLALGHCLYIISNYYQQDSSFLAHYAYYSDIYVGLFFALCVLCIVSVFDRLDVGHFDKGFLREMWKKKMGSFIAIMYVACLVVHLFTANYDDKLSLMSYHNNTFLTNMTLSELNTWNHLSLWRSILAFSAWIFIGLGPPEDILYTHLKNMEVYLPSK